MGSDYVDRVVSHAGVVLFDMAVADGNIVRRGNEAGKSARSSFSSHVSLAATAFVCLVSVYLHPTTLSLTLWTLYLYFGKCYGTGISNTW